MHKCNRVITRLKHTHSILYLHNSACAKFNKKSERFKIEYAALSYLFSLRIRSNLAFGLAYAIRTHNEI